MIKYTVGNVIKQLNICKKSSTNVTVINPLDAFSL